MEDSLNNILLRVLPDVPKKKRPSNKTATKIVRKSVKGNRTKISTEQGFRNYLKYTDPLLRESDETTDKSKIAEDIEKIINLFKPDGGMNKAINNYIRKEPVSNADVNSEIAATSIKKPNFEVYNTPKKIDFSTPINPLISEQEKDTSKTFSSKVKKHVEGKEKEKAASLIQNFAKAKIARDDLDFAKTAKKSADVIGKAYKNKKAREEVEWRKKSNIPNVEPPKKKPVGRPKGSKNRSKESPFK